MQTSSPNAGLRMFMHVETNVGSWVRRSIKLLDVSEKTERDQQLSVMVAKNKFQKDPLRGFRPE
jgi:hypothetical protein